MTRAGSAARFLSAAAEVGEALCQQAVWHAERCSWVGHPPSEATDQGPLTPMVASLGPDLYAGTAGVALFLAQLHALRPADRLRATAEGALRHALHRLDALPAGSRLGLHGGALGVAFATARVGRLLARDDLAGQGLALALELATTAGDDHLLDFIGGNAGAVCALLTLASGTGGDTGRLVAAAAALGDELAACAQRRDGRWNWPNARANGMGQWPQPLNGLAHGAAGMGLALLELHARTGRSDFLEGGLAAFAYEDRWLSPRHGNWADLRALPEAVSDDDATPDFARLSYTVNWCHGAPGIALTRLRALTLVPARRAELRARLESALGAARARLVELRREGTGDATPCHGLAGLTEPFVAASLVLGEPGLHDVAVRAWRDALARHTGTWITGVASGGPNPSLMVGSAGVGYALLRLAAPQAVPSILLPTL